jgi:hypothetical protein
MQASKKFALLAAFIAVTGLADAYACSVSVNDNYQKNLLVAHAASYYDLALTGVTSTAIVDYARSFEGAGGGASCPDYLVTEARVTLEHRPKVSEECSNAITVRIRSYMGDGLPDGPMEEVEFISPELACSTSSGPYIRLRRRMPVRIPRPVIIRPIRFPR